MWTDNGQTALRTNAKVYWDLCVAQVWELENGNKVRELRADGLGGPRASANDVVKWLINHSGTALSEVVETVFDRSHIGSELMRLLGTNAKENLLQIAERMVMEHASFKNKLDEYDSTIREVRRLLGAAAGESTTAAADRIKKKSDELREDVTALNADVGKALKMLDNYPGERLLSAIERVTRTRVSWEVFNNIKRILGATSKESAEDAATRWAKTLDAQSEMIASVVDALQYRRGENAVEAARRVYRELQAALAELAAVRKEKDDLWHEGETFTVRMRKLTEADPRETRMDAVERVVKERDEAMAALNKLATVVGKAITIGTCLSPDEEPVDPPDHSIVNVVQALRHARDESVRKLEKGPPWLSDACEALGKSGLWALNWNQVLAAIRALRAERDNAVEDRRSLAGHIFTFESAVFPIIRGDGD